MGMTMGLRKCAVAHMRWGRCQGDEDLVLPEDRKVSCLDSEESYKYLGIMQLFEPKLRKVKKQLTEEYLRQLNVIWSTELSTRHKVNATNTWAVALFRYSFPSVRWYRRALMILDKDTRSVLRSFQSQHWNAALERVYLPRCEGGRGLHQLFHVWEREVYQHQLEQKALMKYTTLGEAERILSERGMEVELATQVVSKEVLKQLSEVQMDSMKNSLALKSRHSKYWCQTLRPDRDTEMCHLWLRNGRFAAETEALIIAMQDGVLYTREFRANVLKEDVTKVCRLCEVEIESIKHILSCCPLLQWTRYKERHDRVLYQIVRRLAKKFGIAVPDKMEREDSGVAKPLIVENKEARIAVDYTTPMDACIRERKPDIVLTIFDQKRVEKIEVAVAWDDLITDRERQKREKYLALAADISAQKPGWKTCIRLIVIGAMGSRVFHQIDLFTKQEVCSLVREMQMEALSSAVRIARRHLCT